MLLGGSFRPRCVCAPSAARRAALFATESVLCFTDVCRRASRPATRCGLDENEYCAALYGVTLPYSERRGCGLPELFWLVGLKVHMEWPKDDSPARHCDC